MPVVRSAESPLIAFREVTFQYKRRTVVSSLTIDFGRGSTVLVGPNGAGKSTLLQLAVGVLRPRAGHVDIRGASKPDPRQHPRGRSAAIGWMPQALRPMRRLTCLEQVTLAGWLIGLSETISRREGRELLDRVQLGPKANQPSSTLSGGELRRLGLAQALIGGPEFVVLDEPMAGLDSGQRKAFARALEDSNDANAVVLISTHEFQDLSAYAQRVVAFDEGKPLFDGTTREFLALSGSNEVVESTATVAYLTLLDGNPPCH